MLSDVVGERIMTWRKRRGLNRETLAERCAYLGMNLTAESFTNIESGRRKEGVRRRTITVDELMVIARALNVPPVLLLVPLEQGAEDVELTPGLKLPVAEAVEWITGEALAFDDMADDCLKGETTPGHRMMEWTETALPLGFTRAARRELEDYTQAERSLTSAHQALERARGRLKQSEDDPEKRELNELTVSLAEQAMEQAAAALEAARERFVDVRATL